MNKFKKGQIIQHVDTKSLFEFHKEDKDSGGFRATNLATKLAGTILEWTYFSSCFQPLPETFDKKTAIFLMLCGYRCCHPEYNNNAGWLKYDPGHLYAMFAGSGVEVWNLNLADSNDSRWSLYKEEETKSIFNPITGEKVEVSVESYEKMVESFSSEEK